jgi:hypothetical protein
MRCTVSDGRIVAIEHILDAEAMQAWRAVAVAAGDQGSAGRRRHVKRMASQ